MLYKFVYWIFAIYLNEYVFFCPFVCLSLSQTSCPAPHPPSENRDQYVTVFLLT